MAFFKKQFLDDNKPHNSRLMSNDISELPIGNMRSELFEHTKQEIKQKPRSGFQSRKIRPTIRYSTKRSKQSERQSFINATKKIKQQLCPKMQLSANTKGILDELANHVIHLFDQELRAMQNLRKTKTLTVKQLEMATKLCLPKKLRERAVENGYLAIKNARRNGLQISI